MSSFLYSVKQAYLSLKQKPGFVFSVITTMGITLGALLCVLTLAYVMLFKPLPYTDVDKLYKVEHVMSKVNEDWSDSNFSYPSLLHLFKNQDVFTDNALIYYGERILTSHQAQPRMNTTYVTPQWFTLFNMPLALGRFFTEEEGLDSHIPLAVLSYETWQKTFESDANILGRTIRFREVSFTVIGVAAQHFIEPELIDIDARDSGRKSQVWLTWDFNNMNQRARAAWGAVNTSMVFVGKLKTDISPNTAERLITPLINEKWQAGVADQPFFKEWFIDIRLTPIKDAILSGKQYSVLLLLLGVFGLVLIACANIANLFIARMAQLKTMLAISAAVGAKKSQLFGLLFTEAALLMCGALTLALIISSVCFALLQHYLINMLPRIDELGLSIFTLSCAVFLALILALFFALLTSRMINFSEIGNSLHSAGKGIGVQVSTKVRYLLVISQVAIACVLVFSNISLFNAAIKVINEPLGINTSNFIDIDLSTARDPTQVEIDGPVLGTGIKNRLLLMPQVVSVSNSPSPLSGFEEWTLTQVGTQKRTIPQIKSVDENYFQMIEQPLIAGDYFTQADIREGFTGPEGKVDNMVMIINDVLARFLLSEGQSVDKALGSKVLMGDSEIFTIIGIVKGMKMPNSDKIPVRAYLPSSVHSISMLVKLKPNQTLSREQVVSAVQEVTSLFALFSMKNVNQLHQQLLFNQKATAVTTGVLALLTVFLASLGLYGILSYSTQMRRFEIGTRLAIGAKRVDMIKLIVQDNAAGVIIGVCLSVLVLVSLRVVFNAQLNSYLNWQLLPVFLLTLALICGISFIACYLPLRKYINKPALYSLRGAE